MPRDTIKETLSIFALLTYSDLVLSDLTWGYLDVSLGPPDVRSFITLQFSPVCGSLALHAWEVIYFSTGGH